MTAANVWCKFALLLPALLIAGSRGHVCGAQSLHGLRVGSPTATLSGLGAPSATDSYKGMVMRKWNLPDGNSLSVTAGNDGKIAFIESDWNGNNSDPGCDLTGLHFGVTTLTELRQRFGSNGFGYHSRGYSVPTQDGVVMMNSYEAGGAVITFYTKVDRDEFARLKASGANPSPADYARLDAISIADDGYATSEWGERVYDPSYKKIEWK